MDDVGERDRLTRFTAEVFASLARSDQRAKAELYLRGLLLDGGRKSMLPMARRLGIDHQVLQQFVTSSTWELMPVRARLARWASRLVRPVAWVIGDLAFPKDGTGSACVARQYAPGLGKVTNCQVGASMHLVGDSVAATVNWRLFVPLEWNREGPVAETSRRRHRCGVPRTETHRPLWVLAVEMLDDLVGWGLRPPVVVAGDGYGDSDGFRAALDRRGLPYVVRVGGEVVAGTVIRPTEIRRRMEQGRQELVERFGLGHFEGRSWIGWHRHVTLASAAQVFSNAERLAYAEDGRETA
ncbi:IS701 family transposase [Saccharomonospora xinjiangensis]|uniref:IS701 family transposase n=1 Tax=Saccharomonospora xinjiangensis TaxID=75294 RepID=UPI0002E7EE3E|nr:transposase [Saccharomonospora xinjiangensis]